MPRLMASSGGASHPYLFSPAPRAEQQQSLPALQKKSLARLKKYQPLPLAIRHY
jgi:hypothetical protein